MSNYKVTVLGAGLAGCEAALWLAGKGVQVELYEQKPAHFSPAHKSEGFAELICSNSLKAERLDSASGLLKEEMRRMGSQLLNAAEVARVAAGGALAVDRDTFSAEVTRMVEAAPNITVHRERVEHIDESTPILVATSMRGASPDRADCGRKCSPRHGRSCLVRVSVRRAFPVFRRAGHR